MIPVPNMSQYTDAGSTGNRVMNVVQWLPIDMLIEVFKGLYESKGTQPKRTYTRYPAYPTCYVDKLTPVRNSANPASRGSSQQSASTNAAAHSTR